jgi:hypothetical protein
MSFSSSAKLDFDGTDPGITPWPCLRRSSDIPPGLYELSPTKGNSATFYIILYAKAIHFMDFNGSTDAENEFLKITDSFKRRIPELYPETRVLLLWNVTLAFTTSSLMVFCPVG